MYNYKRTLPEGYKIEKEIVEGSSARVYILVDSKRNRIVRKISDEEGINKNGMEKLKKEITFLEYFYNAKSSKLYPEIYSYEVNDSYVYYDMAFIEGNTLTELFKVNEKQNIIKCYNKVLDDLCFYSENKNLNSDNEKCILYEFYVNKTKSVIDKLSKNKKINNDFIEIDKITVNNRQYKNAKFIIDIFNKDEIRNKLIPNVISSCFHGDLISSNIIYNNDIVSYIDPRGEFGKFDICYDIAKMKFSISGYDQVNNNNFKLDSFNNSINFEIKDGIYSDINEYFYTLLRKNNMFSNKIIKQDGYWKERIRLHTALQYINNSYIQIERGRIDKFKVMYAIGTVKLNELLNRLY